MATNNAKKASKPKTSTAKAASKTTSAPEKASVVKEAPVVKESFTAKDIDPTMLITVKNGFQGTLIYISSRTHEKYRWEEFGDEQEIELLELRNAKSSAKQFFINNWFMFDEEYRWVIDYLGLGQYYKYAISLEEFDEIFEKTPAEIKNIISNMSKGQKSSLAYRATQLVNNGEIDSRKVIAALEDALNIELIER